MKEDESMESASKPCPPPESLGFKLSEGRLKVSGSLYQSHLGDFKNSLDVLLSASDRIVTLDFTGCQRLSSLFIGQLVAGIMRARRVGKNVQVYVSPELGHFFQTAHLNQLFTYTISKREPILEFQG